MEDISGQRTVRACKEVLRGLYVRVYKGSPISYCILHFGYYSLDKVAILFLHPIHIKPAIRCDWQYLIEVATRFCKLGEPLCVRV